MTSKSSIHLLIFYMQSKEMFKLTPQLCRLAKKEYLDRKAELPPDVRDDGSFVKVLELIEHIEKSEFALASEILGEAYKEHEAMMCYFPRRSQASKEKRTEPPSIFEDNWQPPVRPDDTLTSLEVNHFQKEDHRNENDKSPVVVHDYERETIDKWKGAGTRDNNKNEYLTTLRPHNGQANYDQVYVSYSPTVLADKFSDLYRNEWKAAHNELSNVLGDKQSIRNLLWIIAKSSIICASLATQQLQDLENSVVGILVSRDPLNKEIRRSKASELGTSLPRRFTGIGNLFINYAEKFIELIWLMYVHDPPMHLDWLTKEQEGSFFRTDFYYPFTRPGTLFDYCIWPIVRLYRNGPMLSKGIAQGR